MKPIEKLTGGNTPHLYGVSRCTEKGFEKYHVYSGIVSWQDVRFEGSVIFGYDESGLMEHVSVSCRNPRRLPEWEVMRRLKDMFFEPDEMAVQVHPAKKNYVHGVTRVGGRPLENVLHLWRPMDGDWSILNEPERWQ